MAARVETPIFEKVAKEIGKTPEVLEGIQFPLFANDQFYFPGFEPNCDVVKTEKFQVGETVTSIPKEQLSLEEARL